MPSDMTVEAYKKEVERLNPCSNGMPSDLTELAVKNLCLVLILVLMECPLTLLILILLSICYCLNPCSNGMPSDFLCGITGAAR